MKRTLSILLICCLILLSLSGCRFTDYSKAVKDYNAGKYDDAASLFSALGEYRDAADYLAEISYQRALVLFNEEEYAVAETAFAELGAYKDSAEKAAACRYQLALALLNLEEYDETDADFPVFVYDAAGILDRAQPQALNSEAKRLSDTYGCGVYIITLSDFKDYDGSAESFWDFSKEFYLRYHLGVGAGRDGVLLIMSMAERDYSLLAYGSAARYVFTDAAIESLENLFLDNLHQNDWYGGFQDYLFGCDELLYSAAHRHTDG